MNKSVRILVVEDDEDDFFLTQRVLKKLGAVTIFHVESGREAVSYLEGREPFADRRRHPLPDLMLLDLKMAEATGHEVLAWLKTQPALKSIKTYVLTGSDEKRDRDLVAASDMASG